MTAADWLIRGDVMRHVPDGREGHVIGLGTGTVLVRVLPGTAVESWPVDELEGTGLWLAVDDGEGE